MSKSSETYHIHISGQVQGVGFRPFICRLALEHKLCGQVSNTPDGVHIEVNCDETTLMRFVDEISTKHPKTAKITEISFYKSPSKIFDTFNIINSTNNYVKSTYVCPDFGICNNCLQELYDPNNRRYLYPFITCTDCGPRLSITADIPYDRTNTSMAPFLMCNKCKSEYLEPSNRRFHSQTNSCPDCAIQLDFYSLNSTGESKISTSSDQKSILFSVIEELKIGKIVAVKSNGGFLLICDASNEKTIKELRKKKKRPAKPFAILYPSLSSVQQDVFLSPTEVENLTDESFPILLCRKMHKTGSDIYLQGIAPDSDILGVMLPCNPLLSLISTFFAKPLIATSANISGSPILYKDQQIIEFLGSVTDFILSHNREIIQPQDDSVIRYSPFYLKKIIIRRSRGIAPAFWHKTQQNLPNILAAGADLKSCIGIAKNNQIYLTQYLGDLSGYDNQLLYQEIAEKFINFTDLKPAIIVKDLHPEYNSSRLLNSPENIENLEVQHHKAHFASILYEHNFWHCEEKCIGIIWDGVGYGEDGNIWGGEFFTYFRHKMERMAHFCYFPYLLGDKMSLQPRLSALCLFNQSGSSEEMILRKKFTESEWSLYNKMIKNDKNKLTSSVGRIFDGVASVLDCGDYNSYEGESAMGLEQLALQHITSKENFSSLNEYQIIFEQGTFNFAPMLEEILNDLKNGKQKSNIAANFHKSLVSVIRIFAESQDCSRLFFSGGVFQNSLLIDMIIYFLGNDYDLYFHDQIAPNDENIALGQIALAEKYLNLKI